IATKVANDLITLFLNEDARNRTNRAMETTKFLAREAQRLETDLGSIDAKIFELKRQQRGNAVLQPDQAQLPQLAVLKAELAQKSAVFSKAHPEVKRLNAQIQALEKTTPPAPPVTTAVKQAQVDNDALDALQTQRKSVETNLENATQKLDAAR